MDTSKLQDIGLGKGEAKVYATLFEIGVSTSGPIAKQADVSPSKVYPILEKLIKKGLVGVVIKGKVKHFEAAGPEKVIGFLDGKKAQIEEQKKAILKILPEFKKKKRLETKAFLYQGIASIKNMYNEILFTLKKGDIYIAYGIRASPALRYADAFFQEWQMERGRKGILGKIVYEYDALDIAKKRAQAPLTQVRIFPREYQTPAGVNIYGDKTAIIVWSENPVLIIIEDKEVADSFRQYFKVIWSIAKPIKNHF